MGISLVEHLGPQDWMTWQYGSFVVPVGKKGSLAFGLLDAADLGIALRRLSPCDGFGEFLRGFSNPTQFEDSIFEAQMAHWCLQRPLITGLCFSPSYSVMGHDKRPDFEIETTLGRIVCECKRLHQWNGSVSERLRTIVDAFDRAAQDLQPDNLRLEVQVNHPINGDLIAAAADACKHILQAPVGTQLDVGPFTLKLGVVGSPTMAFTTRIRSGKVRVGQTPTSIAMENAYLIVSSAWMERALVRAMGALMNAAHRQLPHDRSGMIFLSGPNDHGKEAAFVRLHQDEYEHCVGVGIVDRGTVVFTHLTDHQTMITNLFTA